MDEFNFIMQMHLKEGDLHPKIKAAADKVRQELEQTSTVTVKLQTEGMPQVTSDVKKVATELQTLTTAADKAESDIAAMGAAGKEVEKQMKGAMSGVRAVLESTAGDANRARQALETLLTRRAESKGFRGELGSRKDRGAALAFEERRAVDFLAEAYRALRQNVQGLREEFKSGIAGASTVELQEEAGRISQVAKQLGVAFSPDVTNNFLEQSKVSLEGINRAMAQAIIKTREKFAIDQQAVATDKKLIAAEEKQLALIKAAVGEEKKRLGLRRQVVEQSRKAAGTSAVGAGAGAAGAAGAGAAGAGNAATAKIAANLAAKVESLGLILSRAGRPSFANNPITRTMGELSQDLKNLDKTMRKLDLLELERDDASDPNERAGVVKRIDALARQINAQSERLVRDLLVDAKPIDTPKTRLNTATGVRELLKNASGDVVTGIISAPAARRRMTQFFQSTLGEAFVNAKKRASAQSKELLGTDRAQSEQLANFNFLDFIRGLEQGAPHAELIAKAMDEAGLSAQKFSKENKTGLGILKSVEGSLSAQEKRIRTLNAVEQIRNERARRLAGYYRAIRGLSYTIGGFAIGLTAGQKFREAFSASAGLQQEIAGVQGILPRRSPADAEFLRGGISNTARQYGTDVIEAARAAKIFAQTGLDAQQVMKELNITMLGARGLGITITQMQELQIAVRAVADDIEKLDATARVLDKIAAVESRFAITAVNIADAIKLAAPVVNQFAGDMIGLNDAIDLTIGLSTVMVEQLRISGNQAGNSLKFILARLARPEVLNKLQQSFGINIAANAEGTKLLPLGDILKELVGKFNELDQAQRQQFAVLLSGGRRVNTAIAFLSSYDRALEAAAEAASGFGDIQERTTIQLNTLKSSVEQLTSSFAVFTDSINQGSGLSRGLQGLIGQVRRLLDLSTEEGGGGFLSVIGLLLAGSAGATTIKTGFNVLSTDAIARTITQSSGEKVKGRFVRQIIAQDRLERLAPGRNLKLRTGATGALVGLGGIIRSAFTNPVVVILGVIAATLAVSGLILKSMDDRDNKFLVTPKTLGELGFFESSQFKELQRLSEQGGFETTTKAVDQIIKTAATGLASNTVIAGAGGFRGFGRAGDLREQLAGKTPNQLRDEFPDLRENLLASFLKDISVLGGEGVATFSEMETAAERVADATKLIALAALAANAPIEKLLSDIEESAKTLKVAVLENVLDVSVLNISDNEGFLQGLRRRIGFPTQPLFDQSVATKQKIGETSAGVAPGDIDRPIPVFGDVIDLDGILAAFAASFGELGTELFVGPVGTRLRANLLEVLKENVTAADTFGSALQKLNVSLEDIDNKFKFESRLDSAVERLIFADNPQLALDLNLDPSSAGREGLQASTSTRLEASIARVVERLQQRAIDLFPDARNLQQFSKLFEEAAVANFAVRLQDANKALGGFKDQLVDFFIKAAQDLRTIDIEERVAGITREDFDRPQREFDAAKSTLTSFFALESDLEAQILKDLARLNTIELVGTDDTLQDIVATLVALDESGNELLVAGLGAESERLEGKLKAFRFQIDRFFTQGAGLAEFFPDQPEVQRVLAPLLALQKKFGTTAFDANAVKATEEAITQLLVVTRKVLLGRERATIALAQSVGLQQAELEASTLSLALIFEKGEQLEAQLAIQTELFEIEQQLLAAELAQNGKTSAEDELELQRKGVEFFKEQLSLLARFQVESQVAFDQQVRSNINASVAGVRSILSDSSIIADIFKKGEGAAGARNAVSALLKPLADTFSGRIAENLTASLAQAIEENDLLKKAFGSPEERLRNAHLSGGAIAAQLMIQAHRIGGAIAAGKITTAQGLKQFRQATGDAGVPDPGVEPGPNVGDLLLVAGGGIVGSAAGGLSARANNKDTSQVGVLSGLGGAIGFAAGGGPLGAAIGSAIGGFLGGFLGGDVEDQETAQIQALQAIERAQVETIATIESQTDALLNPANRLINLPTGFTVPSFNPGNAGGLIESFNFDFSGMQINGDVTSSEVTLSIEQAVVQGIAASRRKTSRATRRF